MLQSRARFALLLSAAFTIMLFSGPTARAFYWLNWPGSGTTSSSGDPGTSTSIGTPTVTTTGATSSDPGGTVTSTGDPGGPVSQVPEPASLVIGLAVSDLSHLATQ
jgi:hypothetical protein